MNSTLLKSIPKLNFDNENISFLEHLQLFLNAIDWNESWILALLGFHVFTFFLIIMMRKRSQFLSFLFAFLLFMAYMSETLNSWCQTNWQKFASMNYFDHTGTFISFLYSFPILVNAIIVLICFLVIMSDLLVKVKRAELRQKKKA